METICHSCRAESNYQNTHCVHRQPENYCHEHGLRKPCSSCSQIEYDKQQERYETFKAVALAHIAGWLANPEYASSYEEVLERSKEMTEQFLSSAQEFSVKEGKE